MIWRTNDTGDAALLDRWRAGRDAEAFAEIVTRHAGMVFATCNRILGNRAAAEEVSQECFLALVRGNGEIATSLGGWLHTVAARLSLKRAHSDSKRRAREEVFVQRQEKTPQPQWDDIKRYVDEAIEELPELLQSVVVAHFLEQRTHREIARELGVTRQAVTYRIRKGIGEIRRRLDRQGITLSVAAVGAMISKNAVEAAPATLLGDLGRMAMAGGKTAEAGVAPLLQGTWFTLRTSSLLAVAALIVAALVALTRLPRPDAAPYKIAESSAVEILPDIPGESTLPAPVREIAEEIVLGTSVEELPAPDIPSSIKTETVIPGFTSQISGRVVLAVDNTPVAGIKVKATHRSTEESPSGARVHRFHSGDGTTAHDGSFAIRQLKEADYELAASFGEFTQLDSPLLVDTSNIFESSNVVVRLGEYNGKFGGTLRGIVTQGGNPVHGKRIPYRYDPIGRVGGQDVRPRVDPRIPPTTEVRTDQNGEFVFENMPEGTLSIQISIDRANLLQFAEIRQGEDTVVDFVFPPPGTTGVEGWVTPREVGAGVRLHAWTLRPNGESANYFTSADASGYFVFEGLAPGPWQILALPSPLLVRTPGGLWTPSPLISNDEAGILREPFAPREFYQSYGEAYSSSFGQRSREETVLYAQGWVTTQEGMITRHDLDLSEGTVLRGRVANLVKGESGEVFVFEGSGLDHRTLDATMVDALKEEYPWRQTTLESDGSFRVTDLDLQSHASFTLIVVTSNGRFEASRAGLTTRRTRPDFNNVSGLDTDNRWIESRYFDHGIVVTLR